MDTFLSFFNSPLGMVVAAIIILLVIYYLVQWVRATRNHRDSADDYFRGCLDVFNIGCWLPMSVLLLTLMSLLF